MEYLTLELKERLEAKLAEYEKEVSVNVAYDVGQGTLAKGKVEAIKEALEIFKEVVDYHEDVDVDEDDDDDDDDHAFRPTFYGNN